MWVISLQQSAYSVLNLSSITKFISIKESFEHSMDLAKKAEKWGYHRYWLAEHHNMEGVASSATSVLIGHIAGGTEKIRVGSGDYAFKPFLHSSLQNNLEHWNFVSRR